MPPKRDYDASDSSAASDDAPSPKRRRKHASHHHHQHSDIDATWGQKYVFSAVADTTTIPHGQESDFEDDADAMAYLRSVRSEAYAIPHLLSAPVSIIGPQLPSELQTDDAATTPAVYRNDAGDMRGYYQDGAYMARPHDSSDDDSCGRIYHENPQTPARNELHQAYYASILSRYHRLRRILHTEPPQRAIKRLPLSRPTHLPPFGRNKTSLQAWLRLLRTAPPHPVQLALLHKTSVLRVLNLILGGRFLRRGYTLSERTSQWLWGLLARLPSPEELSGEETACVRDLGLRAVLLVRSLSENAESNGELLGSSSDLNETDSSTIYEDGCLDTHIAQDDSEPLEDQEAATLDNPHVSMDEQDATGATFPPTAKEQDANDTTPLPIVREDEQVNLTSVSSTIPKDQDSNLAAAPSTTPKDHDINAAAASSTTPKDHDSNATAPSSTINKDQDSNPAAAPTMPTPKAQACDESSDEEGEIHSDDCQSEAMDMTASDAEVDDDAAAAPPSSPRSLHAAASQTLTDTKNALLARLGITHGAVAADEQAATKILALRINLRATLDMVLTVAGEFYGQRDLLECREPFLGL